MEDYVQLYADKIESGEIIAPKTIKQLLKRHFSDIEEGRFIYEPKHAERVIKFLEMLPDPEKGKPTKLALFQKFIVSMIYNWRTKEGHRRYQDIFITMARKQGKSILNSGLGLYELIFGESPKMDRQIYTVANSAQQARLVFNMMSRSLEHIRQQSRSIRRTTKVTQNVISFKNEGIIRPLANNTTTLDGLNVLLGIVDEYALTPAKSEMVSVLRTSQSQQKEPLLIIISTAGTDLSVPMYQKELPKARKVLSGELNNDGADAYLPIIYEQDSKAEINDEDMWMKSNPLMEVPEVGETLRQNIRNQFDTAKAEGDTAGVLTKCFNFWITSAVDTFVDMVKWHDSSYKNLKLDKPSLRKRKIYLGVDLSARGDLTSVSWVVPIEEERRLWIDSYSFVGFQGSIEGKIKKEGINYLQLAKDGWCEITDKESGYIDILRVTDFVDSLIKDNEMELAGIFYDPYASQTFITELEERYGNALIEVRQGYKTLSSPVQKFRTDVAEGFVYHADNPLLNVCMNNAEIVEVNNAMMIRKRDKDFRKKIDAVAGVLNAYTEAQFEDFSPIVDINEQILSEDFMMFR